MIESRAMSGQEQCNQPKRVLNMADEPGARDAKKSILLTGRVYAQPALETPVPL